MKLVTARIHFVLALLGLVGGIVMFGIGQIIPALGILFMTAVFVLWSLWTLRDALPWGFLKWLAMFAIMAAVTTLFVTTLLNIPFQPIEILLIVPISLLGLWLSKRESEQRVEM